MSNYTHTSQHAQHSKKFSQIHKLLDSVRNNRIRIDNAMTIAWTMGYEAGTCSPKVNLKSRLANLIGKRSAIKQKDFKVEVSVAEAQAMIGNLQRAIDEAMDHQMTMPASGHGFSVHVNPHKKDFEE